jgi:hypothetical protein
LLAPLAPRKVGRSLKAGLFRSMTGGLLSEEIDEEVT